MMDNIDIQNMSFIQACEALKRALSVRYPNASFIYFASEYNPGMQQSDAITGSFGFMTELEKCSTELVIKNEVAENFVHDVFLNYIISMNPDHYRSYASKVLHDAVVDYGVARGLDMSGIPKILEDKSRKSTASTIQATSKEDDIASRLKMLNDEIRSLEKSLDPMSKAAVLKSMAKRLRRSGDISGAAEKEKEANDIIRSVERKSEAKKKRIENLVKARKVRAERKARLEQAERDRARQQFNPHKAAKARMKKIRERQAERNASKKKAQEGREYSNRPIVESVNRLMNHG